MQLERWVQVEHFNRKAFTGFLQAGLSKIQGLFKDF